MQELTAVATVVWWSVVPPVTAILTLVVGVRFVIRESGEGGDT